MPLTHVCVWDSEIGYRRVSVEEASEMYPYEVSSRASHFVCELCAQNVGFSKARIDTGTRYFFHSSAAQNKDCEDRQIQLSQNGNQRLSSLNNHTMPLRISVNGSRFFFELGFFFPPDGKAQCDRIKIANDSHGVFEYSFDRIDRFGMTYLNVGTNPSRVYGIEYINANPALRKFWTDKASGVCKVGSFFDGKSGRIIQAGGKACTGNSYYLIKSSPVYTHSRDISVKEIARTRTESYTTWYLYQIDVNRFSAESAKFFLAYDVFLTEKPTKFYPIWPPYVEDPYRIYHNSSDFYFYLCGEDAELKAYPTNANILEVGDGKVYKLYARDREQLISIGRSGSLGFSYLIKQDLNKIAAVPQIKICDSTGTELDETSYSTLPKSRYITISSPYDGKAVVYRKGKQDHIYKMTAGQTIEIDGLSYDTEFFFYQGCDCVSTLVFECGHADQKIQQTDQQIVGMLCNCSGPVVPVTHAMGSLAKLYCDYPLTKRWIRKTIRQGEIPRKAVQILLENAPNQYRR